MFSNLGGHGPDSSAWAPPAMRFSNVGSTVVGGGGVIRFDLVVTARSAYTPVDSNQNGFSSDGKFGQINVGPNTHVDLRVRVHPSCCVEKNCIVCDRLAGAARSECYADGCCCFGATFTSETGGSCTQQHNYYRTRYD